jgi:hypothetical protein
VALVTVMVGLAQTATPDYAISTEHVIKIQTVAMIFARTLWPNLKTGRKFPTPALCLCAVA